MPPVICTILAKNYLSRARLLTESFLQHHPDGKVYALFIDRTAGYVDFTKEKFLPVRLQDVPIPNVTGLAAKYDLVEFATAIKPFFMTHLFKSTQVESLCYFDPDIMFFSPMGEVFELLKSENILLTPHICHPYRDPGGDLGKDDRAEVMLLGCGAYNLGFVGVRASDESVRFLNWWGRRTRNHCFRRLPSMFYDQRWVDLVPAMFEKVRILRSPSYNVARWNLTQRPISMQGGKWFASEMLIKFFHFSGVSPDKALLFKGSVFALPPHGDHAKLMRWYQQKMIEKGWRESSKWACDYRNHVNGMKT